MSKELSIGLTEEQKTKVRQIINENIAASDPVVTVWITTDGLNELVEYLEKEGYGQKTN